MRKVTLAFFVVCGAFWLMNFLIQPSYAASSFPVNSTIDAPDANPGDGICETVFGNGICTLRAAVQEANALPGADSIVVPAGIYTLTMLESYEYMYGGGLYITDTLTINGAGSAHTVIDGGGDALKSRLFAIGGSIQVVISDLTMRNGRPGQTGSGGGIFASGHSILTLTNDVISGCYSYAAGGIAIGSKLNLISTTLVNNYSPVGGGILAGTGSVITITDSAIINNVATSNNVGGGGLMIAGSATAMIRSSLIASNTSVSGGGGIYSNGNLTVEDSTIQHNTNSGIYTNGPFVLKRSTIDHNRGTSGPGGISIYGNQTATFFDSTISDNTTDAAGGGMSVTGGSLTLHNVTITGNIADSDHNGSGIGGGINNAGASISLLNSIVARNSDNGQAPDCSGVLASQDYNLIQRLSGCTLTGILTHTITGRDPLLGPLQNNDGATWTRALLPGSPALDAGDNSTCEATDQRGFARPYDSLGHGAICDLGAYEAHFVTRSSFLPIFLR